MSMKEFFKTVTVPATDECRGSVIFLHGSSGGASKLRSNMVEALGEDLTFQHLQIHYPTAPLRPYTINGGELQPAWFDRLDLTESSPEQSETIDEMASLLTQFVQEEIDSGIPINKIIIGGHSMGGGMSLHLGLRFLPKVAGVFCISSFLNPDSKVFQSINQRSDGSRCPKVLMCHGDEDENVLLKWGLNTQLSLDKLGVTTSYEIMRGQNHRLSTEGLALFRSWIRTNFDH